MISKCCGVRLPRLTSDLAGDRMKVHVWRCSSCGKTYKQKLRKRAIKPRKEKVHVQGTV